MSSHDARLTALLASVERMAGGEIEHRMEISPAHDELDALAFAVNVMVGELAYGTQQLAHAKEDAERRSAELSSPRCKRRCWPKTDWPRSVSSPAGSPIRFAIRSRSS